MPSEYLDIDLPIALIDPTTKEIKATPYFEDYLYKIVSTVGGEGSTIVSEIEATSLALDKVPYYSGLIQKLRVQVSQLLNDTSNHIVSASLRNIEKRTANFTSKIKTTNYTAANKDWIEARNKIKITFPSNPKRDDEIMVSNGDGSSITLNGNGYNFKYTSISDTFITARMGSSFHFQFFEDNELNERYWRVR